MTICKVCGGKHWPGPVGAKGTWLEGVRFEVCPNIPPNGVYEHREFEHGPPGVFYVLTQDDGAK